MRTPLGDKIYEILRNRVGRENAIHAHELAEELGMRRGMEREIRRVIGTERNLWVAKKGAAAILVLSFSGGGFFACENYEEYILCRGWCAGDVETARLKLEDLDSCAAIYGFGKPQEVLAGERRAA